MKMFYICLTVVMIFLIGNVYVSYSRRLKEPIFLKHYYEAEFPYFQERFNLEFIDNKGNDRSIDNVYFPNINIKIFGLPYYGDDHTFYVHKITRFSFHMSEEELFGEHNKIELNEAIVTYTDRSTQYVDLGRIILYRHEDKENALSTISGSLTSSRETKSMFKSEGEIMVIDVDAELKNEMAGLVKMTIVTYDRDACTILKTWAKNREIGDDALMKIEAYPTGDMLLEAYQYPIASKNNISFYTQVKEPNDQRRFHVYDVSYQMTYETMLGERGKTNVCRTLYRPSFNDKDIKEFIRINN